MCDSGLLYDSRVNKCIDSNLSDCGNKIFYLITNRIIKNFLTFKVKALN